MRDSLQLQQWHNATHDNIVAPLSLTATNCSETPCQSVTSDGGSERPLRRDAEPPHHTFSRRQKWHLVYLVSLAGCFSPLSSNIYFPALETISTDLSVSDSLAALTIPIYTIVQGIAPPLLGPTSDTCGRRIVFACTLTVFTIANLALAFTSSYPMLLALRGLQAAGSSASISISAGVIGDMASPSERGGFMGTNAGIRMMGQAIGPVIGGCLNAEWGFRSIFWLLFVAGLLVLVAILIFLPETQHRIAGNGSIPLSGFQKPLVYHVRPPKEWSHGPRARPETPPLSFRKVFSPMAYMFENDILALLSWGTLVYMVWSMVTSSTTTALLDAFPYLNQWEIGLCFLPNGLGCVLGSLCTGRLLDRQFKLVEMRYKEEHGLSTVDVKNTKAFPFERARLPLVPYFSAALIISMALYGPSLEFGNLRAFHGADLAAPLGLQFLIGFTSTAIFNINSTLFVDCFPEGAAGAAAINDLCRCMLGAAGDSLIQPLIDVMDITPAFFVLTAVVVVCSPLIWVQSRWGMKWRLQRERRIAFNTRSEESR